MKRITFLGAIMALLAVFFGCTDINNNTPTGPTTSATSADATTGSGGNGGNGGDGGNGGNGGNGGGNVVEKTAEINTCAGEATCLGKSGLYAYAGDILPSTGNPHYENGDWACVVLPLIEPVEAIPGSGRVIAVNVEFSSCNFVTADTKVRYFPVMPAEIPAPEGPIQGNVVWTDINIGAAETQSLFTENFAPVPFQSGVDQAAICLQMVAFRGDEGNSTRTCLTYRKAPDGELTPNDYWYHVHQEQYDYTGMGGMVDPEVIGYSTFSQSPTPQDPFFAHLSGLSATIAYDVAE